MQLIQVFKSIKSGTITLNLTASWITQISKADLTML